jgi:hypothetical protein
VPDGYAPGDPVATGVTKHYKKYPTEMNYYDAMLKCKADGAWLVMPKTSEEYFKIRALGGKIWGRMRLFRQVCKIWQSTSRKCIYTIRTAK